MKTRTQKLIPALITGALLTQSLAACSIKAGSGGTGGDDPINLNGGSKNPPAPTVLEGKWTSSCLPNGMGGSLATELLFSAEKVDQTLITFEDADCSKEKTRSLIQGSFVLDGQAILVSSNAGLARDVFEIKKDRLYLGDSFGKINHKVSYVKDTSVNVYPADCANFTGTYAMNAELYSLEQKSCQTLTRTTPEGSLERYRFDGVERNSRGGSYARARIAQDHFVIERRRGTEVEVDTYRLTNRPCGKSFGESEMWIEKKTTVETEQRSCSYLSKLR